MPVTSSTRWPGVALALTLAVAGCSDGGGRAEPSPPTTATAPAVATTVTTGRPTTTTTRPPERLTLDARLRMDGIGPIRIGMTVDEASAAAGVAIRVGSEDFGGCRYASVPSLEGLGLMVIDGRIVRVDVYDKGRFRTVSGVAIGATEAEVRRVYGSRVTVEPHVYNPTGHYLVYTAADPSLHRFSLLFETDGRVVTTFRAGLRAAVAQPEGCL